MVDETGVLGLIDELSILLEDAKPVFGRNNLRQIDAQAAFDIIDEIRDLFPSEFAQSRQIVRERQSLLDDAEAEASRMIEDARSQAMTIAITVVFPAPVANLQAMRNRFGSAFWLTRMSSSRTCPYLRLSFGATSVSQISVSTASIWQKNGR